MLTPVVALAVDAVAFTFDIDKEADRKIIADLTRVATARALEVYEALTEIAVLTAGAAQRSRETWATQVAQAAKATAHRVAEIAAALEDSNEARASTVALAAMSAAELVLDREGDQSLPGAVLTAAEVATAVRVAAATALSERAAAAALVEQAARSAAAEVAQTSRIEVITRELEASTAAVAVLAITFESCFQAAIDAAATAAEHALANRALRASQP